jgi:outer membrane receptor for ferrienterochelin and colicin
MLMGKRKQGKMEKVVSYFRIRSEAERIGLTCGIGRISVNILCADVVRNLTISSIFFMFVILAVPVIAIADQKEINETPQKHLTLQEFILEEIVITSDTGTEIMGTKVGIKKIEKGKNINIPDVLKSEPDIDLKRRALVGDTTDNLAIRGFTGNRIMLNINGRAVNASGIVGGYYIDWSTIPLDNIEKIELIRGGSSVRYGNNALGGVST